MRHCCNGEDAVRKFKQPSESLYKNQQHEGEQSASKRQQTPNPLVHIISHPIIQVILTSPRRSLFAQIPGSLPNTGQHGL